MISIFPIFTNSLSTPINFDWVLNFKTRKRKISNDEKILPRIFKCNASINGNWIDK